MTTRLRLQRKGNQVNLMSLADKLFRQPLVECGYSAPIRPSRTYNGYLHSMKVIKKRTNLDHFCQLPMQAHQNFVFLPEKEGIMYNKSLSNRFTVQRYDSGDWHFPTASHCFPIMHNKSHCVPLSRSATTPFGGSRNGQYAATLRRK